MYLRQAGLTRNPTFSYLYCVRCRGQGVASEAPLERKYSRCVPGAKSPADSNDQTVTFGSRGELGRHLKVKRNFGKLTHELTNKIYKLDIFSGNSV
jgi:hypothetical protein